MFIPMQTSKGQGKQEAEIPLDIMYSKLVEWLVDRKRVPADWRKRLASVQACSPDLRR